MARDDINVLPLDLPVPVDDGASDHLDGMVLPSVTLRATDGSNVDLSTLEGTTVVYAYPRTGLANQDPPHGWNDVPGARGCTPQSCAFRDHFEQLQGLGARVFGLSTQTTEYQREVVERLHLPFSLLSDVDFTLTRALQLPSFEFNGVRLLKRLTLIARDGRIAKVFYPVFPPDSNAAEVVAWLEGARGGESQVTSYKSHVGADVLVRPPPRATAGDDHPHQEGGAGEDPILGIIGLGSSGSGRTSEDHDSVLAEQTLKRMRE
jgi:peroxiredoxin